MGEALRYGISTLIKEAQGHLSPSCHVKTLQKAFFLNQEVGSHQTRSAGTPILDFSLQNCEK